MDEIGTIVQDSFLRDWRLGWGSMLYHTNNPPTKKIIATSFRRSICISFFPSLPFSFFLCSGVCLGVWSVCYSPLSSLCLTSASERFPISTGAGYQDHCLLTLRCFRRKKKKKEGRYDVPTWVWCFGFSGNFLGLFMDYKMIRLQRQWGTGFLPARAIGCRLVFITFRPLFILASFPPSPRTKPVLSRCFHVVSLISLCILLMYSLVRRRTTHTRWPFPVEHVHKLAHIYASAT
jgi:hypothetical protein